MVWQPIYATDGELRSQVRIGDVADDAQIALALATASRAIDARCARQFGRVAVAEAREYTPRWSRSRSGWRVPIDDLTTSTGLVVKVDQDGDDTYETTVTGYRLRPYNAAASGWPWTELLIPSTAVTSVAGTGSVQVTARWGWPGVPDAIRQACLLQASRLLARRDAPFGVAGSPETGSEIRLLSRLDPDVAVAVEPYRRRVSAA
jgi:hypothetical protein